jgi:preprotein translocase subunit SecE
VKNLTKFLTDVRVELSRVEWPTFNDFVGATIVVLCIVAIFAVFFGIVDKGLSTVAQYIFSLGK